MHGKFDDMMVVHDDVMMMWGDGWKI